VICSYGIHLAENVFYLDIGRFELYWNWDGACSSLKSYDRPAYILAIL
jgi:hypothetical protein